MYDDGFYGDGIGEMGCNMGDRMLPENPYAIPYPDVDYTQYGPDGIPYNYRGPKANYMFSIDENLLTSIGFTPFEINLLENAVQMYGTISSQKLINPPFMVTDQRIVSRVMYAYNICMGKTIIDPDDPISISKHMRKMTRISGGNPKFSALYIKHRSFSKIPRTAVVAGIPQGSFAVLNSKNYDLYEASYPVEKIAQEWVTIISRRKMAVTYKDRLNKSYSNREWGIDGILKVIETGSQADNKPWKLQIHKSRCRLCNRFMIIITTRRIVEGAQEHHGGYVAVLDDGTIVYVYARTTDVDSYGNPKDSVPNTTNESVVFDYGFYASEIEPKLEAAMQALSSTYLTVFSKRLSGEVPYKLLPPYSGMESIRHNPDEEHPDFVD